MLFTPDTQDNIAFLVDLANTHPTASRSGADELSTPAELGVLLERHGYSGRIDGDDAELADVARTRDEVRSLWSLPIVHQVAEINRWLRDASALPHLVRHDRFDWHFHATAPDAPLADRIRAEGALGLAEVVRFGQNERIDRKSVV